MKYLSVTILLSLLSFMTFAQLSVVQLPADSGIATENNYFYYNLPKTAFKVDVVVNKTTQIKGHYAEYAEKLLSLKNIIKQNNTSFQLKSVRIEPITVPDCNYLYAVELSKKQVSNGFLAQLYANHKAVEIPFDTSYTTTNCTIPDFFRFYSDLSYTEKENNYVETQIVDGVVRQVPASTTQKVSKSDEQKAHEAADYIAKIRTDRYDVMTGAQEVPYSKDAIELLVKQLNELEKNYIQLFSGFELNEDIHYTFVVSPLDTSDTKISLFSISGKNGLSTCTISANDNENYYLNLKPQTSPQKWNDFTAQRQSSKKYKANNGYRIRQAVSTYITVSQGKNELFPLGFYPVYQFGKIEILPSGQDNVDISKFMIIY